MSYESNAFELSVQVATAIKCSTIELTDDSVVVNHAHHRHGVNRTLRQEFQNFRCFIVCQAPNLNRLEREGHFTFVCFGGGARLQHWSAFYRRGFCVLVLSNPDSPCSRRARLSSSS